MRQIQLTKGRVALVDDADFEQLDRHGWQVQEMRSGSCYAVRTIGHGPNKAKVYMHRVILGAPLGMGVDHINGDGLDNRRSNLRLASAQQNAQNMRGHRRATSQYKGVSWSGDRRAWQAHIKHNGRSLYLGVYESEQDAARAYNRAAREHFGEFAHLNEVERQ